VYSRIYNIYGNGLLGKPEEITTQTMDQIEVKEYVGGLVKCFERKAA
jgi:hypothetical protein